MCFLFLVSPSLSLSSPRSDSKSRQANFSSCSYLYSHERKDVFSSHSFPLFYNCTVGKDHPHTQPTSQTARPASKPSSREQFQKVFEPQEEMDASYVCTKYYTESKEERKREKCPAIFNKNLQIFYKYLKKQTSHFLQIKKGRGKRGRK